MITTPTVAQLIESVRKELLTNVAPLITDQDAAATLHMAANVLLVAANRAEHEIEWMHQEAEDVVAAASVLVRERPAADAVSEALARYHEADGEARSLADVRARYDLAGEVLSRALEEVLPGGHTEHRDRFEDLLRARMDRDWHIVGEAAQLPGR